MSTTPQFLSGLKQTAQSLKASHRPWSVFLDLTSLNLTPSISDATTRITQNLTHFRSNYTTIFFSVLLFSLFPHPLSLIAIFIMFIAWVHLYFARTDPLVFLGHQLNDSGVLVALVVLSILVMIWGGVWLDVLGALAIGVFLVVLHALLRSTDDLVADDTETSPYVNLLSDDDSPRVGL